MVDCKGRGITMKEFTAQEARAEANARNDIACMKKEIYERIYKAATNGKYGTSYQPQYMELNMAHYVLMMVEFGKKGYNVYWLEKQNRLIITWKEEKGEE
jgi:hypothetical protein